MPTVQSNYGYMTAAREGEIAEMDPGQHIITALVENAGGLGLGKVAMQGANDDGCKAVDGTGTFKGISVRDRSINPANNGGAGDKYDRYDNAGLMKRGCIWVQPYENVAAGDPVYFVTATGLLGKTVTSSTQIPNAEWATAGTSSTLAKLRLK